MSNQGPSIARQIELKGSVTTPRYRGLDIDAPAGSCRSTDLRRLSCQFPQLQVGEQAVVELSFWNAVDGEFRWQLEVSQVGDDPDVADNSVADSFLFRRSEATVISAASECFIATAAYGTSSHPKLDVLREFRDQQLVTRSVGRKLVQLYYRHSLPIARFISRYEWMRAVVRGLLTPIVFSIEHPGYTGLYVVISAGFIALLRRQRGLARRLWSRFSSA